MNKPYDCVAVVLITEPDRHQEEPMNAKTVALYGSQADAQIAFDAVLPFAELVARQMWRFEIFAGWRLVHQVANQSAKLEQLSVTDNRSVIVPALIFSTQQYLHAFDDGAFPGVAAWAIEKKWLSEEILRSHGLWPGTDDADVTDADNGASGEKRERPDEREPV